MPFFTFTKKDLCDNPQEFINIVKERFPSSLVFATDATKNDGLEEILDHWKEGEVAILIGSSGVGKSTIINAFANRELMKTGAIREKDSKEINSPFVHDVDNWGQVYRIIKSLNK